MDGWPQSKLRELLPDRMLATHPELHAGERETPLDAPNALLLPA